MAEPKIHHPNPVDLIRESCMLTAFQADMDFPGRLVSWLSTWLFVWYRSGMVCAYPKRTPITFPVGIGASGSIGSAWLQQELRIQGEALVDDLLCVGITGGVKLRQKVDWKLPQLPADVASCVVGGHAPTCRCNSGFPRFLNAHYRTWRWRAVSAAEFISPRQVKVGGRLYAPGRTDRIVIGAEIRARRASGRIVEALHPLTPFRETID